MVPGLTILTIFGRGWPTAPVDENHSNGCDLRYDNPDFDNPDFDNPDFDNPDFDADLGRHVRVQLFELDG